MHAQDLDNRLAVGAIVSGCLSVLFVPFVVGPLALVLAFLAKSRRQPLASLAVITALAGTALGLALSCSLSTARRPSRAPTTRPAKKVGCSRRLLLGTLVGHIALRAAPRDQVLGERHR